MSIKNVYEVDIYRKDVSGISVMFGVEGTRVLGQLRLGATGSKV